MTLTLLDEETALALSDKTAIEGNVPWTHRPLVAQVIARALLRTQKVAYLLGQIAAMELAVNLTNSQLRRLRELRAELAELGAK